MLQELERLICAYDRDGLNRRQLLQGILTLALARKSAACTREASQSESLFRTHTINHVSIFTTDVARSKAFYQSLTGLPIRDEAKDFCEFRVEGGFLGLYALEPGQRPGLDHFCFGIDNYDPQRTLAGLKKSLPDAQLSLENGDQVYVRDPNGVRVQLADVNYKR